MKKKKEKQPEEQYNLSIFDNYECDGQYEMRFNGTDIEICEKEINYVGKRIEDLKII